MLQAALAVIRIEKSIYPYAIFVVAVACIAGGFSLAEPSIPISPQRLDRKCLIQTFADEFETPLDRQRWKTNWYYGDQNGPSSRRAIQPQNLEDDIFVDDAFEQQRGAVSIIVRPNPDRTRLDWDGAAFLGGMLSTEKSFSQRYGYFEAKITAPAVSGLWPAFWLYDAPVPDIRALPAFGTPHAARARNWNDVYSGGLNGEIDIVELMTGRPYKSYHTASPRGRWIDKPGGESEALAIPSAHAEVDNPNSAAQPHVYGVLWTPREIRWYRDDVEVARKDNQGLHAAMYMILSMGTGGWAGNTPPVGLTSARMTIEYVRAYQILLKQGDACGSGPP